MQDRLTSAEEQKNTLCKAEARHIVMWAAMRKKKNYITWRGHLRIVPHTPLSQHLDCCR